MIDHGKRATLDVAPDPARATVRVLSRLPASDRP